MCKVLINLYFILFVLFYKTGLVRKWVRVKEELIYDCASLYLGHI